MRRLLLVSVLVAASAPAQAELGRGQRELALSGAGSSSRNLDAGSVSATGEYGTYMSPQLEVGIRQSLSWAQTDSGSSWGGATRFYLDYHYGSAALRPYVGASIGALYGDESDFLWSAGPEVGIKYYVQPAAFLFAQAEYQIFFGGAGEFFSKVDDGAFFYSFGAGYNF